MGTDLADRPTEKDRGAGTSDETVPVTLGCLVEKEVYRSAGRGRITSIQYQMWREVISIPQQGWVEKNCTCPFCHNPFQLKVRSWRRTRLRKLYFAVCFFLLAGSAIGLGVMAGNGKGACAYSLAAPFLIFTTWHLVNALRGRLDPSDVVSHIRGKVHRIFDDRKLVVPRN